MYCVPASALTEEDPPANKYFPAPNAFQRANVKSRCEESSEEALCGWQFFLGTSIPLIIFGVVKQVWFDNCTGENQPCPATLPLTHSLSGFLRHIVHTGLCQGNCGWLPSGVLQCRWFPVLVGLRHILLHSCTLGNKYCKKRKFWYEFKGQLQQKIA